MSSKRRISRVAQEVGKEEILDNADISSIKVPKTITEKNSNGIVSTTAGGDCQVTEDNRLKEEFFDQECVDLAKALLGQILVHKLPSGERLSGVIVETEAYCGVIDKAAHSYQGKRTGRTEAMFMKPGTAYVYSIYGMYCCMNISSRGEGCAVLLRAIDPKDGIEKMKEIRSNDKKNNQGKPIKDKDLGNGPSKLCMALDIQKQEINQQDLTKSEDIWLEKGDNSNFDIVTSKRINISYGEDWVDKPLRFYVLDNKCVSVRDKPAEMTIKENRNQL